MASFGKIGYTPGSLYKRFGSGYTAGSQHQRFQYSSMQKMNKQAVRNLDNQVASSASLIYAETFAESEGRSILAAQQAATRVENQVQSVLDIKA
jgi:hypothetical protein